ILLTLEAPSASPAKFLISDGEEVSTAELARRIGDALGRPVRLLSIPPKLLRAAGRAGDAVERRLGLTLPLNTQNIVRLTQSLVIDSGRIRADLGWRPPYDLNAGLHETATWYQQTHDLAGTDEPAAASRYLREPMFKRPFDLCLSAIGLLLSLSL